MLGKEVLITNVPVDEVTYLVVEEEATRRGVPMHRIISKLINTYHAQIIAEGKDGAEVKK